MPPGAYLKVQGAEQLGSLSRQLREAGDKGLTKALYAGLNRAVKPLRAEAKAAAAGAIGNKHGYGAKVSSGMRVTPRRRAGRNPSLRIVATRGKTPLTRLNAGELRHPTFGRWKTNAGTSLAATTRVESGWWERALRDRTPEVRREIAKSVTEIRAQLRARH